MPCRTTPCTLQATRTATVVAASALLVGLTGCTWNSSDSNSGRVDYKAGAVKTAPLEVPPDLTQLANDPRYQPPSGSVISANALEAAGAPRTLNSAGLSGDGSVARQQVGNVKVLRDGDVRWLVSPETPEQLWPKLRQFWEAAGFTLATDQPEAGVMETDWKENRVKIPQDFLRRTLGKVLDNLYDSGERDRFRTRLERTAAGTEIYISHRGAEEAYVNQQRDQLRWQSRPSSPGLEAEMLGQLMYRLGNPDAAGTAMVRAAAPAVEQVTKAPSQPENARALAGGTSLQIDEEFDRAWRRLGSALDRTGFTVEDRDRSQGLYYVRYVDPKLAGKEDPGFFSRLFGAKNENLAGSRYRLQLKTEGRASTVTVQNDQGAPLANDNARNIVSLLVKELR